MTETAEALTEIDLAGFRREGFLVARSLVPAATCEALESLARMHLAEQLAPIEYEVDVQYPGSPRSIEAEGGDTPRRLLHACARHPALRAVATSDPVRPCLFRLFGHEDVELSQCHHNCIMTKHPGYSSATLWHQDNRYWSFDEQNLISVWIALGDETCANGCLRVIPGSHLLDIDPGRFDAARFLRTDLEVNKSLLSQARPVELHRDRNQLSRPRRVVDQRPLLDDEVLQELTNIIR